MVAMEHIEGEDGKGFIEQLSTSHTITLHLPADLIDPATDLRFPSVLARSLSALFYKCCAPDADTSIALTHIFGSSLGIIGFKTSMLSSSFRNLFLGFVKYLYTSKLYPDDHHFLYDMWRLADILDAPTLHNAVVRQLSYDPLNAEREAEQDQMYDGIVDRQVIKRCWDSIDFSGESTLGYQLYMGEVYWGNKKRLMFLLDYVAYQGASSVTFRGLVRAGGDLGLVLAGRLRVVGSLNGKYPWHPENIERYLMSDNLEADRNGSGMLDLTGESDEEKPLVDEVGTTAVKKSRKRGRSTE